MVELMITVAVVGALAAVAVPGWLNLTYRAKRAELPPNVDGIRTAEMSYRSTFDRVVTTGYHPRSRPDRQDQRWFTGSRFDELGWSPDGNVRGIYSVSEYDMDYSEHDRMVYDFVVLALSDIDGDRQYAAFWASGERTTSGPYLGRTRDANRLTEVVHNIF